MRFRAAAVVLLVLLAGLTSACAPCSPGTVFMTLRYDGDASEADGIEVRVTLGGLTSSDRRRRNPGTFSDTLEIAFRPSYPQGQAITIDVVAERAGQAIGSGQVRQVLEPGCQPLSIDVTGRVPEDGFFEDSDLWSAEIDLASCGTDGACPLTAPTCCNGRCTDLDTDPQNCGACGATCSLGVCGRTIEASGSAQPGGWRFNGSARWDSTAGSLLLLDETDTSMASSLFYQHAVRADRFDATFDFQISGSGAGVHADGMGFVIQTNGSGAKGSAGSALGMAGLVGYGVEFDIFQNSSATCSDSSNNHVAIDDLARCGGGSLPTTLIENSDPLTGNTPLYTSGGGIWHSCKIHFVAGRITVILDDHMPPAVDDFAIPAYVDRPTYFFGFVAGSGSSGARFEVRNVSISFPTARCL